MSDGGTPKRPEEGLSYTRFIYQWNCYQLMWWEKDKVLMRTLLEGEGFFRDGQAVLQTDGRVQCRVVWSNGLPHRHHLVASQTKLAVQSSAFCSPQRNTGTTALVLINGTFLWFLYIRKCVIDQLYSPLTVADKKIIQQKQINSLHSSTNDHNLVQYLQNRFSTPR